MIRIAHLSDVHLGGMPEPRPAQLMSKRILGYVNWRRSRARLMTAGHLEAVLADMGAQAPDHIVVTGDLTNIALPGEFENAGRWLQDLGDGRTVTAIPGNHDAYVPRADRLYCELWAPWMSDDRTPDAGTARFPFLRTFGRVALIGVSTAVPTMPFMATGRIGRKQLADLKTLLQQTGNDGFFRIVLIHHPPRLSDYRRFFKRLTDGPQFRNIIREAGAGLILHGHDHTAAVTSVEGPVGPVPVVGVPSASGPPAAGPKAGGFALHDIEPVEGDYALTVIERGFDAAGAIVEKARRNFTLSG